MKIDNLFADYKKENKEKEAKINEKPRMTNPLVHRARSLRLAGMLFQDISEQLGISKSCASNYCKGLYRDELSTKIATSNKVKIRMAAKRIRQEKVRLILKDSPSLSARQIGRDLDVYGTTISRDIKEMGL